VSVTEEMKLRAIEQTLYKRIVSHLLARYALRVSPATMNHLHEWIQVACSAAMELGPSDAGSLEQSLETQDRPTSPGFRRPVP